MLYARGPLRTLHLAAVLAVASASSIRPSRVFERDGTCAADFEKCPQAGLPANFCCAAGSSCTVLAGNTTVLCCPDGSDCSTIQTISCTLSLQDPAVNPKAEVKTTVLNGKLPVCGNGCCPFGYHCDEGNGNCVMDDDQSKKPGDTSSSSSLPSSTPSPTSAPNSPSTTSPEQTTATTTAVAGGTTTPAPSTETPSSAAAKTMNTATIVGGVVGGLFAVALLVGGLWLLRHRRKKAAAELKKQNHDSTSSFGNIISAPIPHADYYTQRLDFLAKAQSSSVATSPTLQQAMQSRFPPHSPYSPYAPRHHRHDSQMSDVPRSHHTSAEIGGLRSLTDRYSAASALSDPFTTKAASAARDERQNSAGSESINIFADPSTVGSPSHRRDTTWTEFQHHADQSGASSPMPTRRR
ncbi:hypothetical protein F5Y19DRAFT_353910 [Xylariaceae sp. FL1651]|nr:hypothetical protein F5Y19DRAFT_353910 [Xylariaceae sp. FL1651]